MNKLYVHETVQTECESRPQLNILNLYLPVLNNTEYSDVSCYLLLVLQGQLGHQVLDILDLAAFLVQDRRDRMGNLVLPTGLVHPVPLVVQDHRYIIDQ